MSYLSVSAHLIELSVLYRERRGFCHTKTALGAMHQELFFTNYLLRLRLLPDLPRAKATMKMYATVSTARAITLAINQR